MHLSYQQLFIIQTSHREQLLYKRRKPQSRNLSSYGRSLCSSLIFNTSFFLGEGYHLSPSWGGVTLETCPLVGGSTVLINALVLNTIMNVHTPLLGEGYCPLVGSALISTP